MRLAGAKAIQKSDAVDERHTEVEQNRVGLNLVEFLQDASRDPVAFLRLEPLLAFEAEGGRLAPGQLLSVYPPFIAATDEKRSYRAINVADRLGFLASFAEQIRNIPDGGEIHFSEYRAERDE